MWVMESRGIEVPLVINIFPGAQRQFGRYIIDSRGLGPFSGSFDSIGLITQGLGGVPIPDDGITRHRGGAREHTDFALCLRKAAVLRRGSYVPTPGAILKPSGDRTAPATRSTSYAARRKSNAHVVAEGSRRGPRDGFVSNSCCAG